MRATTAQNRRSRRVSGALEGEAAKVWRRGMIVSVAIVALVVLALTVLWFVRDDESPGGSSASTLDALPGSDPGLAHVHGLGVDPADGTLYAASHYGVFSVPARGEASRVANRYQDTMGFTIAGPRTFLGSGHPDPRENLPSQLGLIESTDAGKTWSLRSLAGKADLHALEYKHGAVYGFDAATSQFMVSRNKKAWDERGSVPMADFAVSPTDPDVIIATTEQGLARSADGGREFSAVAGAPPLLWVSWPTAKAMFGVSPDGVVLASADGGASWQRRGALDGQPSALTAVNARTVYAATESGIFASRDGGRSFTTRHQIGASQ